MKRNLSYLLLAIGLILLVQGRLHAQIRCFGDDCALLPFSPVALDSTFLELERQYANPLFTDMAKAATLAATAGPPMGTVNLEGYAVGVHVGIGYVPVEKVNVYIPGIGTYYAVTKAGGGISPRAYVGVNAGALLGSPVDSPSLLSPRRFDVYVSLMQGSQRLGENGQTKGDLTGAAAARGLEVRYHLIEGNKDLLGPLLVFRGVSVGAGAYHSHMEVDYAQAQSRISYQPFMGVELAWDGQNRVHFSSTVDTYPIDVRTGVRLFYFLNLTAGGGMVFAKGSDDFYFNRVGPVSGKSDLAAALGYKIPSAVLAVSINGSGAVPRQLAFVRAGLELNLSAVKVSFEYLVAQNKMYGGNIGVRVEI